MLSDIEIAQRAKLEPITEIAATLGIPENALDAYGRFNATVGLGDALNRIDKNAVICLREPSLGPVFGLKGDAAGGGRSQIVPMADINLHFTGDFNAIALANNLLAALIDNPIDHGNELGIDIENIVGLF